LINHYNSEIVKCNISTEEKAAQNLVNQRAEKFDNMYWSNKLMKLGSNKT
jgi:hypothetical protein